jgi:hypothetical protein
VSSEQLRAIFSMVCSFEEYMYCTSLQPLMSRLYMRTACHSTICHLSPYSTSREARESMWMFGGLIMQRNMSHSSEFKSPSTANSNSPQLSSLGANPTLLFSSLVANPTSLFSSLVANPTSLFSRRFSFPRLRSNTVADFCPTQVVVFGLDSESPLRNKNRDQPGVSKPRNKSVIYTCVNIHPVALPDIFSNRNFRTIRPRNFVIDEPVKPTAPHLDPHRLQISVHAPKLYPPKGRHPYLFIYLFDSRYRPFIPKGYVARTKERQRKPVAALV